MAVKRLVNTDRAVLKSTDYKIIKAMESLLLSDPTTSSKLRSLITKRDRARANLGENNE